MHLNLSPGDCPSAQFPAVPAKLWLECRPAPPGAAAHSSTGPTTKHQPSAPGVPAVPRHYGSQPQHDAASHQQGTVVWECAAALSWKTHTPQLVLIFRSALTIFCVVTLQMDMDLKLFGSGMDVKPGTPPVSARSTTPTSSPYRYHLQTLWLWLCSNCRRIRSLRQTVYTVICKWSDWICRSWSDSRHLSTDSDALLCLWIWCCLGVCRGASDSKDTWKTLNWVSESVEIWLGLCFKL